MKLEAGKFYRTRDGKKRFVAATSNPLSDDQYYQVTVLGEFVAYTTSISGSYQPEGISENDLIAPWIDPPWDYTPKHGEWVWLDNGTDYYPWFMNRPDGDVKDLLERGYLFARMDQPPPPPGGSHA